MGLIGTRSVDKQIPASSRSSSRTANASSSGHRGRQGLEALRKNPRTDAQRRFTKNAKADLGFGLLLKKYVKDVKGVTPEMIDRAVNDTVPRVSPLFWSFRLMVGARLRHAGASFGLACGIR